MDFLKRTRMVLPTVYDEALSYYEQLVRIIKALESISEDIETDNDKILEESRKYTDSKIVGFENQISELQNVIETQITDFEKTVQKEIAESKADYEKYKSEIEKELYEFEIEYTNKYQILNNNVADLYLKMVDLQENEKKRFAELEKEVLIFIKQNLANASGKYIFVINPISGKVTDLNSTLEDLYNSFSVIGAITAIQFDNMLIDAETFDSMKISASEYDTKAFFLFFDRIKLIPFWKDITAFKKNVEVQLIAFKEDVMMYSPFDGLKKKVKDVVQKLADLHKTYISANDYDAKAITANSYSEKNVSAYDYDWNAKNIL